ncbi:hypothetical protein BJY52DRAFT_1310921 [Lactarius psammicola]|nr:hypothetical protein BJY52DRAFT_1310921 [Lactarius psammicola]
MSSASVPFFPPGDISSESSADSRFVPADEAFLEPTGVGYGSLHCNLDRGHCHHRCEFFEHECGYKSAVRAMGGTVLADHPTVPSQLVGNSKGEVAYHISGGRNDQIFYTEDAHVKLTQSIHRQCFNCKATETSTWRRSLLSTGKLLCNKCGLFERTHSIPRPEKILRRKTSGSRSLRHPFVRSRKKISPDGGAYIYPPQPPLPAHFIDALYPISEKPTPQDIPWSSPIAPDLHPRFPVPVLGAFCGGTSTDIMHLS